MVIPCGPKKFFAAAGQGKEDLFRPAHLTDLMKRDAAILSWDLRRLLGRNGEEEFVIFPTVEGEIQGVGGAQIMAGRRSRDPLRPNARAHSAGLTEARQVYRKAIAQVDERGGELSPDKKPAEGAAGLGKKMDVDGIVTILVWPRKLSANPGAVRRYGTRLEGSEAQHGNAKPAAHIEVIACPCAGPVDCLPALDFARHNDIDGNVSGNYGRVPAHHGDPVALGKRINARVKLLQPGAFCPLGDRQRDQRVARRSAHRSDVTERAGERTMAYGARRMEVAQEMHPLDGEVRGQYELVPATNLHQRGIVANPQAQSSDPALAQLLEPSDKFIFGFKHSAP